MKLVSFVVGVNLLILSCYTILIHLSYKGRHDASLSVLWTSMQLIAIHVVVNVILGTGFIEKHKSLGKALLLSSLVVLIIGFSTCLGSANLITSVR